MRYWLGVRRSMDWRPARIHGMSNIQCIVKSSRIGRVRCTHTAHMMNTTTLIHEYSSVDAKAMHLQLPVEKPERR